MTFIYKLDRYSQEIYWIFKYELPMSRLSKVIGWQTDKQTDRHDWNYIPHRFAGGQWSNIKKNRNIQPYCKEFNSLSHPFHSKTIHVTRSTFATCAFSVAKPTVWNSLPIICVIQLLTLNNLGRTWRRICSPDIQSSLHYSCHVIVLHKSTFTYLL